VNHFLAPLLFSLSCLVPCSGVTSTFVFGGHGYAIETQGATWTVADSTASALLGGTGLIPSSWASPHLVSIESGAENTEIFNQLSLAGISTTANDGGGATYAWIGFSQAGAQPTPAAGWSWSGGSTAPYTNWGSGPSGAEPDDYSSATPGIEDGDQDFAALGLTGWPVSTINLGSPGQWNDISGTNQLAYVVEFDIIPEPSATLLVMLSSLVPLLRRKRQN